MSSEHVQARYYEANGSPHSIQLENVVKPIPFPGTVVVKVHVTAVNPIDVKVLRGSRFAQEFPFCPGYDIAGVVESVGEGVTKFKPGDRVFCVNWGNGNHAGDDVPVVGGGFAEYSLIHANKLSFIPPEVSDEQAAAVALAGTTAYEGLFEHLHVTKGTRLLILGGSSAVGQLAVQLAKNAGAIVYTTVSDRAKDFVSQFNPDKMVVYTHTDWELDPELHDLDAVFDTIGQSGTFMKAKKVLHPKGRFTGIVIGDATFDPKAHPPLHYAAVFVLRNDPAIQDILVQMIVDGKLKVNIDGQFPFTKEGVVGILNKVASGKSLGKNVLMVLRGS